MLEAGGGEGGLHVCVVWPPEAEADQDHRGVFGAVGVGECVDQFGTYGLLAWPGGVSVCDRDRRSPRAGDVVVREADAQDGPHQIVGVGVVTHASEVVIAAG